MKRAKPVENNKPNMCDSTSPVSEINLKTFQKTTTILTFQNRTNQVLGNRLGERVRVRPVAQQARVGDLGHLVHIHAAHLVNHLLRVERQRVHLLLNVALRLIRIHVARARVQKGNQFRALLGEFEHAHRTHHVEVDRAVDALVEI